MKYFENFPWTFSLYFLLVFYNNNANLNHDMLYEIEHSISKEYWPDSSFKIHIIYILTPPNLVKIKKINFLSDSYSPWNLGSRKPLRIEFQALFERKKSFAWTFVKRQTFLSPNLSYSGSCGCQSEVWSHFVHSDRWVTERNLGPGKFFFQPFHLLGPCLSFWS